MHQFFYEQSIVKFGASENNMQLDIKINKKELLKKNHLENTFDKDIQLSIKKFRLFENLIQNKLKFNKTKKRIYSLSIFVCVLILGFILFLNSQSKEN